jgi:hypothetical protein
MTLALPYIVVAAVAIIIVVAIGVFLRRGRRKTATATPLSQAKQRFHVQRERLEAKFVQLAAAHGSPDAPQWSDCMFDDDVSYVRNRTTGELSAFVAVTISSDNLDGAIHGAADAVGNLQAGTAVFRFDNDHWVTDGRAILNLSPSEAVRHFNSEVEIVAEESAHQV